MERNTTFSNPKSLLIVVACICFAVAVLEDRWFLLKSTRSTGLTWACCSASSRSSSDNPATRPSRCGSGHGIQGDWPFDEMCKSPGV